MNFPHFGNSNLGKLPYDCLRVGALGVSEVRLGISQKACVAWSTPQASWTFRLGSVA